MKLTDVFGSAIWLGPKEYDRTKTYILRGRFCVKQVKRAILRVVGLGFFHCYINGARVSEDLFLPLNSEFEARPNFPTGEVLSGHHLYVPEYDVTNMLRPGENVIVVHFGGGWYTYDEERKFGDAKAIWRIFGEDAAGEFDCVSSEKDRICESFVREYISDGYKRCEEQNFTADAVNALSDEFDDLGWENATPAWPLETEYEFSDCPADRVHEVLHVQCVSEKDGWKVYDCGKNTSGYPVLRLCAEAGERVQVRFAEELNQDGMLSMDFEHGQSMAFVVDGVERIVRPWFMWFGFRYFAVRGDAEPMSVEAVSCAVEVTSSFESDNELLNWIHDTYVNTQRTNMHTGIPSDCPHIERRGYTGDGQLTCHAVMNILGAEAFYRKWMQDIADSQDKLSGHVQYTAPYTHSGGGPGGWGCAIVEVPYQFYCHYGDVSVLEKYYPAMLRYFDYLESHSYGKLVVSDKEGEWCLGDWCPPISVILPAPFVNNYFYIKSLGRCIEIARLIGREEAIPEFERRIRERKEAILAAYYNSWDGNFLGNQQGANAFAVDIGLGDERTYRNLVDYYKAKKGFNTGIFGTDIVTRVLFERGDGQTAVYLLLSTQESSFDGMRRAGATTFWEYWPCSLVDRSHNHPMFGAVVAYLYDYLLGIRPANGHAMKDGILVAPVLVDGINRISGWRTLPVGRVGVAYEKKQEGVEFTVSVPEGQRVEFQYLDKRKLLESGEHRFTL